MPFAVLESPTSAVEVEFEAIYRHHQGGDLGRIHSTHRFPIVSDGGVRFVWSATVWRLFDS